MISPSCLCPVTPFDCEYDDTLFVSDDTLLDSDGTLLDSDDVDRVTLKSDIAIDEMLEKVSISQSPLCTVHVLNATFP